MLEMCTGTFKSNAVFGTRNHRIENKYCEVISHNTQALFYYSQ